MMNPNQLIGLSKLKNQQGVVLLESLIAVLIFSFGIIALIGLQAMMLKNTSGSQYRAEAIFIAQQRLGILWADPTKLTDYKEINTVISSLPGGKRTVTISPAAVAGDPQSEVSITISWQQPGETITHNYTTNARITGI